jgi:hypothetical protein
MDAGTRSQWTPSLVAAAVGVLSGFALGRQLAPAPKPEAAPIQKSAAAGGRPRQAECLATLPLSIASVSVDEPGAPRREGPGLQVFDGQQLRVTARGQREDNQALVLVMDSEGLVHPLWPNSGISAPCPGGCGMLQVAISASTLPPGASVIAVYVGFDRFELPEIQDGIRNFGPAWMETRTLPMVGGARAAASQLVVHGNPPPSP